MPLPSTSKAKSARTWWGYHATPNRRDQRMRTLCVLAAIIGIGALATGLPFAKSPSGGSPVLETWAAPGHVADVHKAWNHDCEACHQPFQPIKSGRRAAAVIGETLAGFGGHFASANERCQRCHAAPAHHANQILEDSEKGIPSDIGNCADCHEDHQGLEHSLVDLDDSKCLRCHADLKSHAAHPELVEDRIAAITEFASAHPKFRHEIEPAAKHKRGLKFSHAVHMMPGMGLKRLNPKTQEVREGGPFRYEQIDVTKVDSITRESYRKAHGNPAVNAPVQLVCNDCHQLDALRSEGVEAAVSATTSLPAEALDPVRGEGRYYLPIIYEKHCQACHPLGFDSEQPEAVVAHGLQPEQVQSEILKHFSKRFLQATLTTKFKNLQRKPADLRLDALPELLTAEERAKIAAEAEAASQTANAELYALLTWAAPEAKEQLDKAAIELFKGRKTCGECHTGTGELMPGSSIPKSIDPVNIPAIWQTKARFDHLSHQAVACQLCHPNSFGSESMSSEDQLRGLAAERQRARDHAKDVAGPLAVYQHPADLPTLESCKDCHSQRPWWATGPVKGGVAQRCTECHTYHNAEHGLQGRGARSLLGKGISSQSEFLQPSVGWDRPQTKN